MSGCNNFWTHPRPPSVWLYFRGFVELGVLDRCDSRGRDVAAVFVLPGDVRADDTEAEGAETAERDGGREDCCAIGTGEDGFESYRDGCVVETVTHDMLRAAGFVHLLVFELRM
jgi:hypothetical protein